MTSLEGVFYLAVRAAELGSVTVIDRCLPRLMAR
jgi:hypothetical protein